MGDLQTGTVIAGRYMVRSVIGRGGMGTVYAAQDRAGAEYAVKVMLAELAGNAGLRARFEQEARLGAGLACDNVVRVFDAGVDASGAPYIAMELLRGKDLAETLRERASLTRAEVVEVVGQMARALAVAHARGVVHRDLKPENIFLAASAGGIGFTVKVLDFGIAKIIAASGMRTTAPIGTLLWMAPEQTTLKATLTPAADIWPLGLLAFAMLTGAVYWVSPNDPAEMLREMLVDPLVAPSERARARGHGGLLPEGFDAWFARCVARAPEQRFADANAAAADLARALGSSTVAAAAPDFSAPAGAPKSIVPVKAGAPAKKKGAPWAVIAAGAAVLVGVVALVATRGGGGASACDDPATKDREAACAKACDGGGAACATYGALLDAKRGRERDAYAAYKKGCDKGADAACVGAARHQRDGVGVARDEAAAAASFEKACAARDQHACTELARAVEVGAGVKADPKRALELYGKACTGKIGVACLGAAAMLELGETADAKRMAHEAEEAAKLLGPACDAKDAESCGALGRLALVGLGMPADLERARVLLGQACDQNHLESCAVLAGVEDEAAAERRLRGACDAGGVAACGRLGQRLREADKNADEAKALLDRACDAGDGVGCYGKAMMVEGDAKKPLLEKAAAPLARACALGDPESCEAEARLRVAGGKGADSGEEIKAKARLDRACNGGRSRACTQLGWFALNRRAGAAEASRPQALGLYQKACDASPRDPDACARQGLLLLARHGVGKDPPVDEVHARNLFRDACKHGSKLGCYLEKRENPSEDESLKRRSALAFTENLKAACTKGELDACFELARALMQAGRADVKTVESLLKAPCDRGDARACGQLGYALDQGALDAGGRPLEAAALYHRACDADVDFACIYLAGMWTRAAADAKDKLKAEGYVDEPRADAIRAAWCAAPPPARKAHCDAAFSAPAKRR